MKTSSIKLSKIKSDSLDDVFSITSPDGRFRHCHNVNYFERLFGDFIKKLSNQVIEVSEAAFRRNFWK